MNQTVTGQGNMPPHGRPDNEHFGSAHGELGEPRVVPLKQREGILFRLAAWAKRPLSVALSMMAALSALAAGALHAFGPGLVPLTTSGALLFALCVVISVSSGLLLHLWRRLSATELDLDLILNYSSLRILYKDDANNVMRLNKVASDMFGMSTKEATGRSIYELNPNHARKHHLQDLEIIASGEPSLGEVKEVGIAGNVAKWNRVDKIPYKDPQTGDDRILVIATDLTDQVETERALRRSEERYNLAVEQSAIGTWERDFATGEVYWSPRILEMLGITDPNYHASRFEFEERLHPEDYDRVMDALMVHLKQHEPYMTEFRWRREDGRYLWLRSRGQAVWDDDGKPARMAGSLEDITANIELEHQLVQAQKMEAVGQLTGGLAHDFNNLLAIILGNLQLLERSLPDDEKMKKRASAAVSAAEKGAELTRRLLAFARRQQLEAEACDVNRLVADMSDLLGRTLGETIEIENELSDGLGRALVDPSQFEAAILNLAVNARDAMPDGGRLVITTAAVNIVGSDDSDLMYYSLAGDEQIKPGDYIVVSVSDTGTGIAPEDLERIFDPFFTTKEVGKGSGLGLSMVYGFMKQSGGHVGIYSELGKGTTVRMYVPADTGSASAAAPEAEIPEPEPGGGETILIVEDNEGVREVVTGFLDSLGYQVAVAQDGPSALKILAQRSDIDLLFTDIVMPGGMLGTQLANRARAIRPDLPVVFTTGFASPEVLREASIDASQPLVSKPYRKSELATAVRAALNAPAPAPALATVAEASGG